MASAVVDQIWKEEFEKIQKQIYPGRLDFLSNTGSCYARTADFKDEQGHLASSTLVEIYKRDPYIVIIDYTYWTDLGPTERRKDYYWNIVKGPARNAHDPNFVDIREAFRIASEALKPREVPPIQSYYQRFNHLPTRSETLQNYFNAKIKTI